MSPKWARLSTTRDMPLLYRMGSVFENGTGDEGPLAKGCCLLVAISPLIFLALVGVMIWMLV